MINVTLLAGGVGGAKMAEGFSALPDVNLTVIGNVADDEEFHGLWVSPDIDTLLYSLSGRINREQGWGVANEGRRALDVLTDLGSDTWMFLGDSDFGLHIYRTERLRRGDRPSDIVTDITQKFGIRAKIVLPSNDRIQTRVKTENGWLSFQEYFVKERCAPEVLQLDYDGIDQATITPEAEQAIAAADLIVIAPSNPLVSIAPILGVPGLRDALQNAAASIVAVSPLIGGKVVKGPADRMMRALNHRADSLGIAEIYRDLASDLFIDHADADLASEIASVGPSPHIANILMTDLEEKARLAREVLAATDDTKLQGAA